MAAELPWQQLRRHCLWRNRRCLCRSSSWLSLRLEVEGQELRPLAALASLSRAAVAAAGLTSSKHLHLLPRPLPLQLFALATPYPPRRLLHKCRPGTLWTWCVPPCNYNGLPAVLAVAQ